MNKEARGAGCHVLGAPRLHKSVSDKQAGIHCILIMRAACLQCWQGRARFLLSLECWEIRSRGTSISFTAQLCAKNRQLLIGNLPAMGKMTLWDAKSWVLQTYTSWRHRLKPNSSRRTAPAPQLCSALAQTLELLGKWPPCFPLPGRKEIRENLCVRFLITPSKLELLWSFPRPGF